MSQPRYDALRPRTWLLAGILALGLPASSSASILGESIIDDGTYFALIAETGFGFHVNGSLFKDAQGYFNYPNFIQDALYTPADDYKQAGPRNSYPWGMAWFNNALYVGTNRNIHCTVGGSTDNDIHCPAGTTSTSAIPDAWWYAEIWRYTPSALTAAGDYGLSGTWQRVFRSPAVNSLMTLAGTIPSDTPRDVGYRMLKSCNAGGTDRLYAATYGLPGAVLYMNTAGSFAATAATPETTVNLQRLLAWQNTPSTFDLGFRALTCFKGNLWTSPTGTPEDPDISFHPKVYRNTNPAGGASWIQVADLKTANFDLNTEGIFQMEAIGDYLFLSVINRTTGWQLWRGTLPSTTTTCGTTAASCPITWEKIIDKGAGRPGDAYVTVPDPNDPSKTIQQIRVSNAVATLGVYQYDTDKYDLYMGVGESGYSEDGLTAAELLRIRDVQTGNKQWELMVGWPRKDYKSLLNMTCQTANIKDLGSDETPISSGGRGSGSSGNFPPGLLDDPEDTAADDCFPVSGYGPGMGTKSSTDLTPAYYSFGIENYYWRMAEHEHTFYIGTLGRASLWRIDYDPATDVSGDNPLIERVFTGGLNDPNNAGVRTLISTPLGLALGFTNPDFSNVDVTGKRTGGLEIYIASDLFPEGGQPGIPPIARAALGSNSGIYDANADGIYDFFAAAGKSTVDIKLVDNGSYSPFGGAPITTWEWYDGDVSGASCASPLNGYTFKPTKAGATVTFTPTVDATFAKKTYTLRVGAPTGTGGAMLYSCDTVTVTATTNLPPKGDIIATVPLSPPSSDNWSGNANAGTINLGQLNLIDFDANGSESYSLTGVCDGQGDPLASCAWVVGSNTMTPTTCTLTGDKKTCQLVSNVTSPVGGSSSSWRGSSNTISLVITDVNGYTTTYRVTINVQAVGNNPVCRNADLMTDRGAILSLNPATYLLNGNPICVDKDSSLTYAIRTQASQGVAWADTTPLAGISYLPDLDFTAKDQFAFRASDGTNNSSDTAIRVTINPDSINLLPSCENGNKIIPPTTFKSGNTSLVAFNGSITTQGAVVVSSGANVTFESPQLSLRPGFKVAAGGIFQGIGAGACL